MSGWRDAVRVYGDRRVLAVLLLGFASGLPFLLTYSTLSAWLATAQISRASIGLFALVGLPYAFKVLWAPLIDRLPPPLPLGRRRGWGVTIQLLLIAAVLALGRVDPQTDLGLMAVLAVTVAFLSASQDVVIDAYRVEILELDQQGPGAAMVQAGYRLAMLTAGAGSLVIAQAFGWFAAYASMAALLGLGVLVFLLGKEPSRRPSAATLERERQAEQFLQRRPELRGAKAHLLAWLYGTFVCPFADFATRPLWPAILIFVITYKLGEAMAGVMATPLYVSIGFSLNEIASVSKIFGFFATIAGVLIGGAVVNRIGAMRALLLCGILQSMGNLFYVLQAAAGHHLGALALCVAAENLTGGMAATALVAYISGLCNTAYTATQYALLSSLTAIGRTVFASSGGALAERLGWESFFLLTSVLTIPALLLLVWIMAKGPGDPIPVAEDG